MVLLSCAGLRCRSWLQVTQKYLEHLISQKKFNETAAACAKLLKVPFIINRRNTTCHTHF